MMSNKSRILFGCGVIATIVAISCKSDNELNDAGKERVDGQLFIVQQDRENVKLGDVKVILMERSVFDEALNESVRQSQYLEGLLVYKKKLADVSKQVESDAEVYVKSSNDYVRYSAEFALKKLESGKRAFSEIKFVEMVGGDWASYSDHKGRFEGAGFDRGLLQAWCLSYLFNSSGGYAHLEVTTTDADGRFSLNIPADRDCLILAKSSRSLMGDKDEKYYWAHPFDLKMEGALILSNSNMLTPSQLSQMLDGCGVKFQSLPLEGLIKDHTLPDLQWYVDWREAMRGYNKAEREEGYIRSLIETNKRSLESLTREALR